jgi:Na+-translocating ferredoxin:NAD+ oxidoreductase RnfE subunit
MIYTILYHRERRDFPEFMLHHIVTCALVMFSYAINAVPYGATIMLVHDSTDIFVNAFRAILDVTRPFIFTIIYTMMLVSWIYCLLYYYPFRLVGDLY